MSWEHIVDLDRALVNCHYDMLRDWHLDPWGWPELDWVVKERPEFAFQRLAAGGAGQVVKLDVAKENFSVRPAVIVDPVDRLIYQALVDRVSLSLIGELSGSVFGWRLPPGHEGTGEYAHNGHQYAGFRSRLTDLANSHTAALKTDIVSCFASIPVAKLIDRVQQQGGHKEVTDRLAELLDGWDRVDGRSGIVQRSLASCVLANCYLQPLDDVVNEYAPEPSEREQAWGAVGASARWMDDIWLFDDDPGRLRHAQLDIQNRMQDLGLRMNGGKTEVIEEGEELINAVLQLQHSAVDDDLAGAHSLVPLNALIDALLDKPETANRTSVRFITKRMRDNNLFDRVGDFIAAAERMPHASDALARMFRDSGSWSELDQWFVDYAASHWGVIDWAVAQLGRMFPTSMKPSDPLSDYLAEQVLAGGSLAISSLACQRLGSWAPDHLRAVLRERRDSAVQPLERRVLGLAALAIRDEAWLISELLSQFPENAVTLALIEERSYQPIPAKADFSGD